MANAPRIWLDYRPVRIGWVIADRDIAQLVTAAQWNTCCGAGAITASSRCTTARWRMRWWNTSASTFCCPCKQARRRPRYRALSPSPASSVARRDISQAGVRFRGHPPCPAAGTRPAGQGDAVAARPGRLGGERRASGDADAVAGTLHGRRCRRAGLHGGDPAGVRARRNFHRAVGRNPRRVAGAVPAPGDNGL